MDRHARRSTSECCRPQTRPRGGKGDGNRGARRGQHPGQQTGVAVLGEFAEQSPPPPGRCHGLCRCGSERTEKVEFEPFRGNPAVAGSSERNRRKSAAAHIGPMVWELDGPDRRLENFKNRCGDPLFHRFLLDQHFQQRLLDMESVFGFVERSNNPNPSPRPTSSSPQWAGRQWRSFDLGRSYAGITSILIWCGAKTCSRCAFLFESHADQTSV